MEKRKLRPLALGCEIRNNLAQVAIDQPIGDSLFFLFKLRRKPLPQRNLVFIAQLVQRRNRDARLLSQQSSRRKSRTQRQGRRSHSHLTRAPEGILVADLSSRNGTFVDGVRINGKVLVKEGQEIGLASFRFQLLQGSQLAQRKYYANVTIEGNETVVHAPNGKRLLNPVSLTVFPSELVALMGLAGAGKTTLLKALNGYTRPVEGKVLFNGYSIYDY